MYIGVREFFYRINFSNWMKFDVYYLYLLKIKFYVRVDFIDLILKWFYREIVFIFGEIMF